MAAVAIVAASLLTLVVLSVGGVWFFQERIAFQPPGPPYPHPQGVPRVEYSATDGQLLFAYLIGDRDRQSHALVIAFHGNADLAAWQVDWAEEVNRRTGITVMLAEYRGYMGLGGRPSYEGSRHDSEAAYRHATDSLGIPPERIAFFGHSLGSAIAAELAIKYPPAALLLQSPFTSAKDMAGVMTGLAPLDAIWRIVSRLHFDTGAIVALIDAPVSVAHGNRDRLVPAAMGHGVFKNAKRKGQWLLVADGSHNDVALIGGEMYWQWVTQALKPLVNHPVE